ncbi:hypothetical protein GCM10023196_064910 [Actinoallomurus vinaceus]|uniref:Uncharacterized protein n=1 Tax=Actinoallomurus vinaceus TaxID=1080074 RepID=A0ABP8UKL7_9ACTN
MSAEKVIPRWTRRPAPRSWGWDGAPPLMAAAAPGGGGGRARYFSEKALTRRSPWNTR